MIESLESRRLLSTAVASYGNNDVLVNNVPLGTLGNLPTLTDGLLRVNGTSKADTFLFKRVEQAPLTQNRIRIFIAFDGTTVVFNADGERVPQQFEVHPFGDDDVFITDPQPAPGPYIHVIAGNYDAFVEAIGVQRIAVDAGAGNDYVEITRGVNLRTTLIGARGDDTLGGGTQGDYLSGGAGDDVLFDGAGTAADILDTGPGLDLLSAGERDTQHVTAGSDLTIFSSFSSLRDLLATLENRTAEGFAVDVVADLG